jgi:hypothetical protein
VFGHLHLKGKQSAFGTQSLLGQFTVLQAPPALESDDPIGHKFRLGRRVAAPV